MRSSPQNPKRKSTSRTPSHHPVMGTNIPYLSPPLPTAPSLRHRSEELASQIKRETDAERRIMVRRHTSGSLNVVTPCAACKLLRRRCAQECPFSPYFSPHEPHKFASVHKVFGASNVSKMLMEVPESQRADAANSLVYEANMRMRDPVYGCMGAISALQQQVQILEAELTAVREEILRLKYGQASATVLPTLLARAGGLVSVAAPPLLQVNGTALAPFSMASASSSSLYTPPPSASSTDYSSVTNENVPYFG